MIGITAVEASTPAMRMTAKSCAETSDKNFCKTFHADDQAYFSKVSYWTTPRTQCGDARGSVCKDYAAWVQAWTEIKG